MERLPWSYHNLIEVDTVYKTSGGQALFSSDKLLQLQKLETVHCSECRDIEQIFDSPSVAEIPNLRQVDLEWLDIKYIWKRIRVSGQPPRLRHRNVLRQLPMMFSQITHTRDLFSGKLFGLCLYLRNEPNLYRIKGN